MTHPAATQAANIVLTKVIQMLVSSSPVDNEHLHDEIVLARALLQGPLDRDSVIYVNETLYDHKIYFEPSLFTLLLDIYPNAKSEDS